MGEKIKVLHAFGEEMDNLEIELNRETRHGLPRNIHIQNQRFRLSMTEDDFIRLALCMIDAQDVLLMRKGIAVKKKGERCALEE